MTLQHSFHLAERDADVKTSEMVNHHVTQLRGSNTCVIEKSLLKHSQPGGKGAVRRTPAGPLGRPGHERSSGFGLTPQLMSLRGGCDTVIFNNKYIFGLYSHF